MFRKTHPAPSLAGLGNMPPSLEGTPARTFSELYGGTSVQNARLFIVLVLSLGLNAALVFAIVRIMPLKQTVPYMVKVDEASGQVVGKPVEASEFKVETRMIEAESRAFVRNLFSLDPFTVRKDIEKAAARTTGKAATELREYMSTERPFERLAKTPGLIRTTEVTSVDASQKNIVFVFAQTAERINAGEPIVTRWRITLHYVIDPAITPKSPTELTENPLGFVVTHFERVQDAAR